MNDVSLKIIIEKIKELDEIERLYKGQVYNGEEPGDNLEAYKKVGNARKIWTDRLSKKILEDYNEEMIDKCRKDMEDYFKEIAEKLNDII